METGARLRANRPHDRSAAARRRRPGGGAHPASPQRQYYRPPGPRQGGDRRVDGVAVSREARSGGRPASRKRRGARGRHRPDRCGRGKMSLGYSFGLLPANRGLVDYGVYRVVRHPIYLGYLITHASFLLSHPSVWNVVVMGGGDLALIVRAFFEEQILTRDAAYKRYCATVKWRLVPGVY